MPILCLNTPFELFRILSVLMLDFFLCLIAEQIIQTMLSEQEAKWKLVISKLDTKVNKSHELYDFSVNLLKK
jgi:hypothetical protein